MIEPGVQVDFLKQIQVSFNEGVPSDVIYHVLKNFLYVAMPTVLLFVIIRYYSFLSFFCRRAWDMQRNGARRGKIAHYIQQKELAVGLYLITGKTRQYLGNCRLYRFSRSRMGLSVTSEIPSSLRRVLQGKKVLCITRPFRVGRRRLNSFASYVRRVQVHGGLVRGLVLLTPDEYIFTSRRKRPRLRILREQGVRLRVWNSAKKASFVHVPPDYKSVDSEDLNWKASAVATDISSGGMKMRLRPQRNSPVFLEQDELVLEVQVFNPADKNYRAFYLLGVVRSSARLKGGLLAVGVQFRAQGERTGNRGVRWHYVDEEIGPLRVLLKSIVRSGAS
ncbi:MAG: hypothetical protein V3573_02635 [Desulfovibrionaceae bacterium]